MQNQLVCRGCGNVLLCPWGALNVRCAMCSTITPGMEMSHLVCGGCGTLLMYTRGATSLRCFCCQTINRAVNQVSQVNCGQCHTTLMYPYGAPSVRCAVCHYVTNIGMSNIWMPTPPHGPSEITPASLPSTFAPVPHAKNQTVVVENPMTVDESGKLVSNVVVGVTNDKI